MKVHYMSKSNEWATPVKFFEYLDNRFGRFNLDPCSTHENAKCENHFTIEDDGLQQSWGGYNSFINPPYGRQIKDWIEKGYKESLKENTKVTMLIPARTDTIYWHDWIFGKADIYFIKGRLKFNDGKDSAPFPSAVIVYDNSKSDKEITTIQDWSE